MKNLISEDIGDIKEVPLSGMERGVLMGKKKKQLLNLLSAYVPMVLILIYISAGSPGLIRRDRWYGRYDETEIDWTDYYATATIFCGFLFILLTVYFMRYYLRSVHSLVKDIKKGTKLVLSLRLEKREPFFNRHFIYIPLRSKRQLEVNADDYYKLRSDSVQLVIAPHSHTILQLLHDGQDLEFRIPA